MEKSFPFNAALVNGEPDRVYSAEDLAAERAAFVSNGVTSAEGLVVRASGSGGMAVDVAAGAGVMDGYTYWNTSPLTLALEGADGALGRIDAVVLRLDLDGREMRCRVIQGTPAQEPTAPTATVSERVQEMVLALVEVPAGTAAVSDEQITDVRPRADYILNRLEVEEVLGRYEAALREFFDVSDAEALARSAQVVKTDAGAGAVLCGDGQYRAAVLDGEKREELVRFTANGTFRTAEYPSKDGLYDVILIGGGGSGAWGPMDLNPMGGESGGVLVIHGLPLRSGANYAVTVGAGGAGVYIAPGGASRGCNGIAGGMTRFAGFTVYGGQGGVYLGAQAPSATVSGAYTHNAGTAGAGGRGGESLMAAGGVNNFSGIGGQGSLGSGGGAAYRVSGSGAASSGRGGDGIVIIRGVRKG